MKLIPYLFWLTLWLAVTACARKSTPVSSRSTIDYNSYNEDLSAARPSYTVTPASSPATSKPAATPARRTDTRKPAEALHINRRLDAVLDTIAQKNRSVRYASGYRVQIYVGNERRAADDAKLKVYKNFPELNPYLEYKQPTYRLKVGDFMRRVDAERYLDLLKQQFSLAVLQADRVDIRRSLSIK
ncbi:hypothetical protein GCM10023189_25390 [Nibrella saemangeumensis]|uniref:SPOR domain-containing protein n=1 Tax=Nibrella saemangeumensis TaxID=1084526 RepID=A0ABP8MXA6_9BACT